MQGSVSVFFQKPLAARVAWVCTEFRGNTSECVRMLWIVAFQHSFVSKIHISGPGQRQGRGYTYAVRGSTAGSLA